MAMTQSFTCRQCGRAFTLPPAVLARYPGWTPPLCNDCRLSNAGNGQRSDTQVAGTRGGRPKGLSLDGGTTSSGKAASSVVRGGPQTGVFTDGACSGNPGPGGWGVVKVVDGAIIEEASGGSPQTTNNRMELTALIEAMERLTPEEETTVYTDSALCANTINLWAAGWERQGWTRGPKREPIANLDLVQRLYELAQAHPRAKIEWIKGHTGNQWNEYADGLARAYHQAKA